jgi:hypothetical protein
MDFLSLKTIAQAIINILLLLVKHWVKAGKNEPSNLWLVLRNYF